MDGGPVTRTMTAHWAKIISKIPSAARRNAAKRMRYGRFTLLDSRPSASQPDRGVARFRYEVINQAGTIVMTLVIAQLLRRRPG